MRALIKGVKRGSIAHLAGIRKGDTLLAVNGEGEFDILYYRFLSEGEDVTLRVQKASGVVEEIEIVNSEYENLGITFEEDLIDRPMSCQNKCIFCFIDQLPRGMRKSLYFKDDDYRLSMLTGSYITLTNLSDGDINKIIKMRLPRINISVHSTNEKTRSHMLSNKNADVFAIMERFAKAKIAMNCQIVLCKGINDGQTLHDTVCKLFSLYPHVQSVSVVPVGLTSHREGLPQLEIFDEGASSAVIAQLSALQKDFLSQKKTRFVFPSDEFYISAKLPVPPFEEYEDFLQIENGVGLVASFNEEFNNACKNSANNTIYQKLSIATGKSAAPFIKGLVGMLSGNEKAKVYTIKNEFFGENITVSGLITGCDLIKQLIGKDLGSMLLIPKSMLNIDGLFLDDMTPLQVQQQIGVRLKVVENDGGKFFKALTARKVGIREWIAR
ncbi:MAG: DUF512 domain-containing protein [Firmicutes bacterium]|nr:DUF512 domain-containing protein [Bacillota bacterium]